MAPFQVRFRWSATAGLAAVLALVGPFGVSAEPAPQDAGSFTATSVPPDFQNVWVHYDYMVFPKGWTSTGGITYPNGLSMAPSPHAIDRVVAAFAAQGLTLHIDPLHNAIPGHQVLIPDFFSDWTNPTQACVGPDAVSFLALKKRYFRQPGNHPWHYAIFAFNAGTPDTGDGSLCPLALDGPASGYVNPLGSGLSEVPGFNFIVSLGADLDQGFLTDEFRVGGTFMHELGHNFGLQHGGVLGYPEEARIYKPNYISVMNYSYQNGILYTAALGSTTSIGARLDYSRSALDPLNEADLNEFLGVNAGTTDIVINLNTAPSCFPAGGGFPFFYGPAQGPIDWNCDGGFELHAAADVDNDNGTPNTILYGFDDWSYVKQQLQIPPDAIEVTPKKMEYENAPKGGLSTFQIHQLLRNQLSVGSTVKE